MKKTLTLSMILFTVLMTIGLLSSMHFEFEVGADGGKRLTVDFARESSNLPPEIKTVEPEQATPLPEVKTVEPTQTPPAPEVKTVEPEQATPPPELKVVEPVKPTSAVDATVAERLIIDARTLIERGDYDEAIESCNKAMKLDPNNMSTYVERGRAYFYCDQHHEALADLNKAIAAGVPELAVAYNARGCAYLGLKEYKKALADMDEATRLDPNFRKPYENRIIVYRELSSIESARVKQLK